MRHMDIFRRRLRKLVARAKADQQLTQEQIANEAGISRERFKGYLNSTREPEYTVLMKICTSLGTHPNYLFGLEDDPAWPRDSRLDRIEQQLGELTRKIAK